MASCCRSLLAALAILWAVMAAQRLPWRLQVPLREACMVSAWHIVSARLAPPPAAKQLVGAGMGQMQALAGAGMAQLQALVGAPARLPDFRAAGLKKRSLALRGIPHAWIAHSTPPQLCAVAHAIARGSNYSCILSRRGVKSST